MRPLTYVCGTAFFSLVTSACAASGRSQGPPGNPCDRGLVGRADVAGIMTSPVVMMEALEGDPQSCVFSNALHGQITVMVRPGLGNVTVSGWEKGQMNGPATPIPGVGDRAVWQDTLNELIATKNDVLCDVSVIGSPGTAVPQAKKRLGDLCNTIFSRL
jgi:hypothetical protein